MSIIITSNKEITGVNTREEIVEPVKKSTKGANYIKIKGSNYKFLEKKIKLTEIDGVLGTVASMLFIIADNEKLEKDNFIIALYRQDEFTSGCKYGGMLLEYRSFERTILNNRKDTIIIRTGNELKFLKEKEISKIKKVKFNTSDELALIIKYLNPETHGAIYRKPTSLNDGNIYLQLVSCGSNKNFTCNSGINRLFDLSAYLFGESPRRVFGEFEPTNDVAKILFDNHFMSKNIVDTLGFDNIYVKRAFLYEDTYRSGFYGKIGEDRYHDMGTYEWSTIDRDLLVNYKDDQDMLEAIYFCKGLGDSKIVNNSMTKGYLLHRELEAMNARTNDSTMYDTLYNKFKEYFKEEYVAEVDKIRESGVAPAERVYKIDNNILTIYYGTNPIITFDIENRKVINTILNKELIDLDNLIDIVLNDYASSLRYVDTKDHNKDYLSEVLARIRFPALEKLKKCNLDKLYNFIYREVCCIKNKESGSWLSKIKSNSHCTSRIASFESQKNILYNYYIKLYERMQSNEPLNKVFEMSLHQLKIFNDCITDDCRSEVDFVPLSGMNLTTGPVFTNFNVISIFANAFRLAELKNIKINTLDDDKFFQIMRTGATIAEVIYRSQYGYRSYKVNALSDQLLYSDLMYSIGKFSELEKYSNKVFSVIIDLYNEIGRLREVLHNNNEIDDIMLSISNIKVKSYRDMNHLHTALSRVTNDLSNLGGGKSITDLNARLEELYDRRKELAYRDDKYTIFPALTVQNLREEGNYLHHCVGGYDRRHANGETTILFLRKNDDLFTPYYTIEYNNRINSIVQIHGMCNSYLTDTSDEVITILAWCKEHNIPFDSRELLRHNNNLPEIIYDADAVFMWAATNNVNYHSAILNEQIKNAAVRSSIKDNDFDLDSIKDKIMETSNLTTTDQFTKLLSKLRNLEK